MELEQIRKKVQIIFENERRQPTIYYTRKKEERKMIWGFGDYMTKKVIRDPEKYEFRAPNVDLLKALDNKLNTKKEREFFCSEVQATFRPDSNFHDLVSLSFETMFRLNKIKEAVKLLIEKFKVTLPYLNLLRQLIENLRFEYNVFADGLLNTIGNWAEKLIDENRIVDIRTKVYHIEGKYWFSGDELLKPCSLEKYINDINNLINEIQHSRLKEELLEDVNWEINQDINKVEEKIELFGMSKELSEGIREIEKTYRKADSAFDFKTCVDYARSFLENLNKEVIPKIENKCGIKFTGDIAKAKEVIDYFGKKGVNFLIEKEQNLCRAVYGLASGLGVHSLVSKREYARISKNIITELALLILDRLEKYLSKSAN